MESITQLLLPRWSQQDWMVEALCHGRTDLFFPPQAERPPARARREALAGELCGSCPVSRQCQIYARIHREHGFWGGESEDERVDAGFSPAHPIGVPRLRRVG